MSLFTLFQDEDGEKEEPVFFPFFVLFQTFQLS